MTATAIFDYAAVYTEAFFEEADGIEDWRAGRLKYGDALAAIGYTLGLSSFEAVQGALDFTGMGQVVEGAPERGAVWQLQRLQGAAKRSPRGVLEIGSGRGEVAVSLAHLGYPVQAIEPSPGAAAWHEKTARHFFGQGIADLPVRILNAPAHQVLAEVDFAAVDTVLLVESLEHILAEDFAPVYERAVTALRETGGRLIVTNWIDYHPIDVGWYAATHIHCRLVDDALYDAWSAEAKRVAYRRGSHLVLDY